MRSSAAKIQLGSTDPLTSLAKNARSPTPFPVKVSPTRLLPTCLVSALLLLAGCREPQVVAYRIPKEKDPTPLIVPTEAKETAPATIGGMPMPAADAGAAMAGTPVATALGASLQWKAPAHWQPKPTTSMRRGTYLIAGEGTATAELAITAFPGDVGGEVANVNRWRGQLALTEISAAAVTPTITRIEAHGLKIGVVDLTGTANGGPARLLGAMVPFGNATWFFKLIGPDALIAKEKAAFLAFLQTVQPAAPTP